MAKGKCVACGAVHDGLVMCGRCAKWFADFAAQFNRVPTDDELPEYMRYA